MRSSVESEDDCVFKKGFKWRECKEILVREKGREKKEEKTRNERKGRSQDGKSKRM